MEFTGERFVPEKLKETDEIYQEHLERYCFACGCVKGLVVLDAACGVGFGSRMLSDHARQVHAVDISQEAIDYASEKYYKENITYRQMDVAALKYPDAFFDAVVSFETVEHVPEPEKFLGEIQRVLKPGGLLIISTPNRETASKGKEVHTPFHIKEFTLDEMMGMLSGFSDKKVFAQKMTYHKRPYKKLRLLSRHAKPGLRKTISSWIEKRYPVASGAWFLRVLLYEFKYKFKVLEFIEKNPYIKPTIFVITGYKRKV